MLTHSKVIRQKDNKEFVVTYLSHWSEIVSKDGNETDKVKIFGTDSLGNDLYVGVHGETYRVKKEVK